MATESATDLRWARPMNQERKADIRTTGNGVLSARTHSVSTGGTEHQLTERRAYQSGYGTDRSLALALLRCNRSVAPRRLKKLTAREAGSQQTRFVGMPAIGAATEPLKRILRVSRYLRTTGQ
jgi:hypothetical protein